MNGVRPLPALIMIRPDLHRQSPYAVVGIMHEENNRRAVFWLGIYEQAFLQNKLNFCLPSNIDGIIDFTTKIPDGALQRCMPEKQLNRAKIFHLAGLGNTVC